MKSVDDCLSRARVVLKDTTHSGNIGATARAMRTMGLRRLFLVAPRAEVDAQARAMAAGADNVLDAAVVVGDLAEALAGCTRVFALTARRRELSPPEMEARQVGENAAQHLQDGGDIAFVFGGERSGLENEDLHRASFAVRIAAAADYRSLNLAQAAQIMGYELRRALLDFSSAAGAAGDSKKEWPTHEETERLAAHCGEFLSAIELPRRGDGALLRARLRHLMNRADPSAAEVRLLRGVLKAALRAVKNGGGGKE